MGKKNRKKPNPQDEFKINFNKIHGRRARPDERRLFQFAPRGLQCLQAPSAPYVPVTKLCPIYLTKRLFSCRTIEHQIIELRDLTQLSRNEYMQRLQFTRLFLDCLYRHHNVIYQGILFGSTVNGLGFRDSDVDLRLRPLKPVGVNPTSGETLFEPMTYDSELVECTLRNIAFQTTNCCFALGDFVPSTRCPVAKLEFLVPKISLSQNLVRYKMKPQNFDEGLKYDVSLTSTSSLGAFNSIFLRFLCFLEPKFHLLATVIKYWSNVHQLIVPGYLSSYALVNMLIFFCQTTSPPILPTIDHMRELFFKVQDLNEPQSRKRRMSKCNKGITQLEWQCIICLDKKHYVPSINQEPLSVLLLKFFETYLKFPYSTHIITTRPGQALEIKAFKRSNQFHPQFPIKTFLNIQDPFDLTHNLTLGMQGGHFRLFMLTIRHTYEKLYHQLMTNFTNPAFPPISSRDIGRAKKEDPRNWGLLAIFQQLTDKELQE